MVAPQGAPIQGPAFVFLAIFCLRDLTRNAYPTVSIKIDDISSPPPPPHMSMDPPPGKKNPPAPRSLSVVSCMAVESQVGDLILVVYYGQRVRVLTSLHTPHVLGLVLFR